jgi:hypothetical protein
MDSIILAIVIAILLWFTFGLDVIGGAPVAYAIAVNAGREALLR